jgi:hypothetical protein
MHKALRLARKLYRQGQLNALAPCLLLHIVCETSQRRFLVDTGAAFSVLPFKGQRQPGADLPRLQAAGGQAIQCFGELKLTVTFGSRAFNWTFLLADVETLLLGADFLKNYRLLVDLHSQCLVDAVTRQQLSSAPVLPAAAGLCQLCCTARELSGDLQ